MIFYRSETDYRLCANMHISECATRKLEYYVVWLYSDWPTWESIWKTYFLHLIFSHCILTETHRIIPCCCISITKSQWGPCWPMFTDKWNRLSNCWTVIKISKITFIPIHIITNQISFRDDKSTLQCWARVFCPQLIRNVPTHRRIDSSSITTHTINFDIQRKNVVPRNRCIKNCVSKLSWVTHCENDYNISIRDWKCR